MGAKQPMVGRGFFHWSTGGWFGTQLGGTAWMLLAATWVARASPWLATVWLFCFAVVNAVGIWLWLRRDQIAPSPAFQLLGLSVAGGGLLILGSLDWFWPDSVPRESLRQGYAVFLATLVALALFSIVERRMAK
jgi:hypothetical protein